MKNQFPGYFRLPEATIKKMWKEGMFSFDANFLLNFYRYSKETRVEIFKITQTINDRIWVTNQAALEFLRNRLVVIAEQEKTYDAARRDLKKIEEEFKAPRRHPFISEPLLKQMSRLFKKLDKELERRKDDFAKLAEIDDIQDELVKLLAGKIGSRFSEKRLSEIQQDGEKRYKDKIPPGFRDQSKEGEKPKYGDLILWYQLIEKAAAEKKPVIFVTDDAKEDWWRKSGSKTIGPRPELIDEIKVKADVDFYAYSSDRFMEFAQKYLNQAVEKSAIDEVKEVRESGVGISGVASLYPLLSGMDDMLSKAPNIASLLESMNEVRKASNYFSSIPLSALTALSTPSGIATTDKISRYMALIGKPLDPFAGLVAANTKPKEDPAALQVSIPETPEPPSGVRTVP